MDRIICQVTPEFVEKSRQELYSLFLYQYLTYSLDDSIKKWGQKVAKFARISGIILSMGAILYSFYHAYELCGGLNCLHSGEYKNTLYALFLGLVFLFFLLFFVYLPAKLTALEGRGDSWSRKVSHYASQKLTQKALKQAEKLAPYIAIYEFENARISCFREKEGSKKLAWKKELKGFALAKESATVIFKSSNSVRPEVIFLHEGFVQLEPILKKQNIEYKILGDDTQGTVCS